MFGFIADKVKAAAETISDAVSESADKASSYLSDNWDSIQNVITDGLLTVAHDRLKDDEVFSMAMEKAFELLPMPVRLFLPRDAFQRHTLIQRENIIRHLEEKQALRLAPPEKVEDREAGVIY